MTTRLTPEQIQLMKDELTTELVGYLLDDYHYTPEEAIDVVYTSETFERLQDDACYWSLLPESWLRVLFPRERTEDRKGFLTYYLYPHTILPPHSPCGGIII